MKETVNICAESLIKRGLKIATAESCTGGLISKMLTDRPGSSDYFDRGFVTYSNPAKIKMLGVPEETIREYGAVSKETALEMAKGALSNSEATISVAVTGIAGPGGGTADKPAGTVCIAVAANDKVFCEKFQFSGDRESVREQAAAAAIKMVIKNI